MVLRELREFFGLPVPKRQQHPPVPLPQNPNEPIVRSSDTSHDDQQLPEQAPIPDAVDLVNLAESFDELPDLEPPPQHYIQPVALRKAFVILERYDRPLPPQPLQPACPMTPPPTSSPRWIGHSWRISLLPFPVKNHRRGRRSVHFRGMTLPSHRRGMGVDAHSTAMNALKCLGWAGDSPAIQQ